LKTDEFYNISRIKIYRTVIIKINHTLILFIRI